MSDNTPIATTIWPGRIIEDNWNEALDAAAIEAYAVYSRTTNGEVKQACSAIANNIRALRRNA